MWTALTAFIVAQLARSQLSLGAWFAANATKVALKVTPYVVLVLSGLVIWSRGDAVAKGALVMLVISEFVVAWVLGKLPAIAPAK